MGEDAAGGVGATCGATLPRSSGYNSLRQFYEPSETDLEEKLATLQSTRQRLELQLPALVRGSSEEDLLSTDMSRAESFEDLNCSSGSSSMFCSGDASAVAVVREDTVDGE